MPQVHYMLLFYLEANQFWKPEKSYHTHSRFRIGIIDEHAKKSFNLDST